MQEPDELYVLRNNFWLGNYQRAITEGSSLSRLSEALKIEAKEFVYRSYIALGQFNIVIDEIADDPSIATSLQAVKLLARYLSQPQDKEMVLMTLNEWLTGPQTGNPSTLQLIAAIIYLHEDNTKDALRCIHLGATMEHLALTTQIYLQMNRPELAQKTVRSMQQADEDATLTQLAIAWSHLGTGGAKLQEAAYIFDELIDKFEATSMLLNGHAVANIHLGKYEEAERLLVEALSKGQNDPNTLINIICCFKHQGKSSDLVTRYVNQLKTVAPQHGFVMKLNTVEGAFKRVSETYAAGAAE
jgi:coatomer protein complex subunit epsilon